MVNTSPSTLALTSQPVPPDTPPVQRFASQSDCRTGDLSLGRQAVLKDIGKYLQVPYVTLVHSVFGTVDDGISQIRDKLIEDGTLIIAQEGANPKWADMTTVPAKSNVSESVAFQPLATIISKIFHQISKCNVSYVASPDLAPLSERGNMSRPDAYILHKRQDANRPQWFEIVVPFEFKKTKDRGAKRDNEQKIIWSLHHIMREDPLRRFALGITIEDTDMRIWYGNRAFVAASEPIDFITNIDDVTSLFYMIGMRNEAELGWDPTASRILDGNIVQYKFKIGNNTFTTTHPLATFGADAMIGRGTRVYQAGDDKGNIVAIKDSWRDEDREPEGTILKNILKDIQDTLEEKDAKEAMTYFVKVRDYGDVEVSGKVDKTLNSITPESNTRVKWVALNIDPFLSKTRHSSSAGHIPDSGQWPAEPTRYHRPWSDKIQCKVHTRTVFEEVGIPVMNLTHLADSLGCLLEAVRALYYLHKAGWVHRDFSVANMLRVLENGQWVGKLTDFEYAKKVDSKVSHDVRTGTMQFMAVEVESQRYLFRPPTDAKTRSLGRSSKDATPDPPFRMNFLHDLESEWWAAMWILFYHTDMNSPTEKPDKQLQYFNQAFPHAIGQASRRDFFTDFDELQTAFETLSTTYRESCADITVLALHLQDSYRRAEKSYPHLVLDDSLLEDIYTEVLQTHQRVVKQLTGSEINLQPLWKHLKKKRGLGDSPTDQKTKRVKGV